MMSTATSPRHHRPGPRGRTRAADLPAPAGGVRARRGLRLVRRRRARAISTSSRASASPSLGHAHPALVAARCANRLGTLLHTSNLFFHPLQARAGRRACRGSPGCRARSSATAARKRSKRCLKFARRFWYTAGHAAHAVRRVRALVPRPDDGRAVGDVGRALSRRRSRRSFPASRSSSADDPRRLPAAVTIDTAAVIVEPIQGEGGVRPLPPADGRRDRRGVPPRPARCCIADEVQCGLGRTGVPFYSRRSGLQPDLMALGKALGAGVPIGAAMFSDRVAAAASPRAITAAPTAATCWRAAPRWSFLDSCSTAACWSTSRSVGAHPRATACARWPRGTRWSRRCAAPA